MNDPFVTVDLHGLMRGDAMQRIDKALRDAGPGVYQLRLVHGYHRGTSLRDMIRDEYRYHEKVLRVAPGDNPGITVLILRKLY